MPVSSPHKSSTQNPAAGDSRRHRTQPRPRRRIATALGAGVFATALIGYGAFGVASQEHGRILRAQSVEFEQIADFVRMGGAWGDRSSGAHGTFGTMPGGASSPPHSHTGAYHAIVLSGTMTNPFGDEANPPEMTEGSYWYVAAGAPHVTACVSEQPCLFYFHADGAFDFAPAD